MDGLDAIVAKGQVFEDSNENTSEEQKGSKVLQVFEHADTAGEDFMALLLGADVVVPTKEKRKKKKKKRKRKKKHVPLVNVVKKDSDPDPDPVVQPDDADDVPLAPKKKEMKKKKKKKVTSLVSPTKRKAQVVVINDNATDMPPKKKKAAVTSKKAITKRTRTVSPKSPQSEAINHMAEGGAFVAVFAGAPQVVELLERQVDQTHDDSTFTEVEMRFLKRWNKQKSRYDTAADIINEPVMVMAREIRDKLTANEPMTYLVNRLIQGELTEMYIKANPPQPRKNTEIQDVWTGEVMSERKSAKEQKYIIFRDEKLAAQGAENPFIGCYVATTGANLLQFLNFSINYKLYLYAAIKASLGDEISDDIDQSWSELYTKISQEFNAKDVVKWTKTKDVVKKGSFVDTVIQMRRLLEIIVAQ